MESRLSLDLAGGRRARSIEIEDPFDAQQSLARTGF